MVKRYASTTWLIFTRDIPPVLIGLGGFCIELGLLRECFQSLFAQGLFVQQEFGGADTGSAVEPTLNDVILRQICQREQTHALVMGHPGTDQLWFGALGVVGCFVEAVGSHPAHRGHAAEVGDCRLAEYWQGEKAGVGGDDRTVLGSVFEGQFWNAPGLITVSA